MTTIALLSLTLLVFACGFAVGADHLTTKWATAEGGRETGLLALRFGVNFTLWLRAGLAFLGVEAALQPHPVAFWLGLGFLFFVALTSGGAAFNNYILARRLRNGALPSDIRRWYSFRRKNWFYRRFLWPAYAFRKSY